MSNPYEFKKIEWLKIEFNNKIKRIFNPSKDLYCLSNQVKTHFKELNECMLVNTEQIDMNEFCLVWVTSDQQRIVISDSDQLEEIYMLHCVVQERGSPNKDPSDQNNHSKGNTLRFQVVAKLNDDQYKSVFSPNNNGSSSNTGSGVNAHLPNSQDFNRNEEEEKKLNKNSQDAIDQPENMKQSLFFSSHDNNFNNQPDKKSNHGSGGSDDRMKDDDDLKASTFKSCHPTQSSLERHKEDQKFVKNDLALNFNQHLLGDIKSQKSEEVHNYRYRENQDYDELNERVSQCSDNYNEEEKQDHKLDHSYSQSSDEDDDDLEEIKIISSLKNLIKKEVERQCVQLCQNEPDLQFHDIKQEETDSEDEEDKVDEEEKEEIEELEGQDQEEQKIENSQLIDISVSMSSHKPINPLTQSQKFLSGLQTFKNFFKKKILPNDNQLYAIIQGQPEIYFETESDKQCSLTWKIKNCAEVEWPKGLQLVPIYSQPVALINAKDIKAVLKPNDTEEIQVNLFIPKDIKESYQIVMFRLRTQDREFLGQPLIAFIKVKTEQQQIMLNQSENPNDANQESQQQLQQSKSLRKSSIDDFTSFNLSDEQLLGMASLMFDEGYGSFDRCYGLIRALRGDLKKARDILSQLIFYECHCD